MRHGSSYEDVSGSFLSLYLKNMRNIRNCHFRNQIQIVFSSFLLCIVFSCTAVPNVKQDSLFDDDQIVYAADLYLLESPTTVTADTCVRSAGIPRDFYSEGDYWWPNPENPDGPFIRKDGQSNPDNFLAHRKAMRKFSRVVATLTGAYKLTGDLKYADRVKAHLHAWFVNEETSMTPHLLYSQAIKGRSTGRYIGVIDGIHLIEVARSVQVLAEAGALQGQALQDILQWFRQYVEWLTEHQFGIDERDHGNNHSTWWASQVAAYAALLKDDQLMQDCRDQFKKLLQAQMDEQGGFPDELSRTKPYNYTLFNIEGYAIVAYFASTSEDNLWGFVGKTGSLQKAIDFMLPYMEDKSTWPYTKDVSHFDELPIQSGFLLFATKAYDNEKYLSLWKKLPNERQSEEVDRNYPLRQLILWE